MGRLTNLRLKLFFHNAFCILLILSLSLHSVSLPTSGRSEELVCRNPAEYPFDDYSVKIKQAETVPVCIREDRSLQARGQVDQDDYSCSASRPCRNGACCSKASGYCGYGPESCGTNNQSPNDVCWSNCDAKAECGRFAEPEGKECPLNVCCSQYGFCGMSEEFCVETDDEETSCQSNCDQPGSGRTDGDVRSRIIGYYEGWVADRACNGMSIDEIPTGALTHLFFSFGYITPGSFEIVPMDDLDPDLFTKITNLKRVNSGLKVIIALGGWTFNDPGTATQPVFSNICSTAANRATFIANLLSFLRFYAFDGVDFDWEYPGADDRGGQEGDGANFVKLLKELKEAIEEEPIKYVVSFTTPTSYWYLRHFDLKAVDYVDFVNVMSYDLHGVWDSWNPIGSQVLGHTNLTEIKLALDLYWRNGVPPEKLNLGIGFYGRTFQLTDPTCYKPGCGFKGGASPGSCTENSGTLSYFEIQEIIKNKNIKPYYDKEAQVKYIVWDNDQWASYDDKDTIEAKIEFANKVGLGGLLIWSIDQDTPNREALQAVVGTEGIALFAHDSDNAAYWQGIGAQDCYVTDCGGSCKTGFIKITTQPCGDATWLFRHSTEDDSTLCCPINAAPDPDDCTWRGEAPPCNGHCQDNEVMLQMNRWGSGAYCEDGNKAYCCKNQGIENTCYWTGVGGNCNSGDKPLTFAGTFLSTIADIADFFGLVGDLLSDALDSIDMDLRRLYCCPPDMLEQWTNCAWHGEPGSCYDNHCDLGHQVQLAQSDYGGGQSCAPRLERTRVFCCDAADGQSPFLPVPLDYLFPNPPEGDDIDTDFDLRIDNTWGDGDADTQDEDDPNDATFAFWIMTSPEEIQVSLDKRDGSHWELFNCNDAISEEEQTVQMLCTDVSADSNCHKIGLGKGVPGTILGMPQGQGCGPAKYAVAKSLTVSKNQTIPHHLEKRGLSHKPVVFDLTFDYDWKRVPRDYGETQVRVDFSNQVGYWDSIVDKAATKKKKRSLADVGGNHRRWLEEEWRDDQHFGALSSRDLHERWFGQDILDWLKGLLNVDIKPTFTHDYDESITAVILQDSWSCDLPEQNLKLEANIDARATAQIQVSSSFGMTILTTLPSLDLSNSYLFLQTKGAVSAIFTIDAMAKATFDSGEFNLATLPFPGASFSIPKLLTVGPKFNLKARAEAEIEIDGHFETRVEIASWDIQQTYPEPSSDWEPKSLGDVDRDINIEGLKEPTMDLSVTASGQITAHLIPTLSFGISFDDTWDIGECAAEVLVDGWMRARAEIDLVGGDAECPSRYAVDAGSVVIARAKAPDQFKWSPTTLRFFPVEKNLIPGDGSEWVCPSAAVAKRNGSVEDRSAIPNSLDKRSLIYGPFFHIPKSKSLCPNEGSDTTACNDLKGYTAAELAETDDDYFSSSSLKRSLPEGDFRPISHTYNTHLHHREDHHPHQWSKRSRDHDFCEGRAKMSISFPKYPDGTTLLDCQDWSDCNNFNFDIQTTRQNNHKYINEHILELQMIKIFMDYTYPKPDRTCQNMQPYWGGYVTLNGVKKRAWDHVALAYPTDFGYGNEIVVIEEEVNLAKERAFSLKKRINDDEKMQDDVSNEATVNTGIKSLKNTILAYKYLARADVSNIYATQVRRVGDRFEEVETALRAQYPAYPGFNLKTQWLAFMKSWTTKTERKFDAYFVSWAESLDGWDPVSLSNDQNTPARQQLIEKVRRIRAEVETVRGTWVNPL